MLVVMDNLNAIHPGEDASLSSARSIIPRRSMADVPPPIGAPPRRGSNAAPRRQLFGAEFGNAFTEMMLTNVISIVERTYRALRGREFAQSRDSRWAACNRSGRC